MATRPNAETAVVKQSVPDPNLLHPFYSSSIHELSLVSVRDFAALTKCSAKDVILNYAKIDLQRAKALLHLWESQPNKAWNVFRSHGLVLPAITDLRKLLRSVGLLSDYPPGWVDPFERRAKREMRRHARYAVMRSSPDPYLLHPFYSTSIHELSLLSVRDFAALTNCYKSDVILNYAKIDLQRAKALLHLWESQPEKAWDVLNNRKAIVRTTTELRKFLRSVGLHSTKDYRPGWKEPKYHRPGRVEKKK